MIQTPNDSPFIEAHKFNGVHGASLEDVRRLHPGLDADTVAKLCAPPPLTRSVSLHFSDGTYFDVQHDHTGQYLVLQPEAGVRPRVYVGEWICKMKSGRYVKFTDAEFKDLGGVESPHVPPFPY